MQNYWRRSYTEFPKFLCPRCSKGRLHLDEASLQEREPVHSAKEDDADGWNPDWIEARFACFLVCDAGHCGEVVAVSGDRRYTYNSYYEELLDDDVVHENWDNYPKSVFPAPHIIKVSKRLNEKCKGDLLSSFSLIWNDPAACANRMRTFIEHLLDQMQIPRVGINGKGAEFKMNLKQRIEELDKKKPGHEKMILALKKAGDYASHQGGAKFEALVKCFSLLEHVLADLVDGRKDHFDKLADALLADDAEL